MKRIGRGNVCIDAIRVLINSGIMQEGIAKGLPRLEGTKMEIMRIGSSQILGGHERSQDVDSGEARIGMVLGLVQELS